MKPVLSKLLLNFLAAQKNDKLRFILLKKLFEKNGKKLNDFKSFFNDRFFIYKVNNNALPTQKLNWACDYENFEAKIDSIALIKYQVRPGDIIIDIGAGVGEEVVVLANRVGPTGKVYAIEANPQVAQILSEVVKLNQFQNVEVHNLAIYKNDMEIYLEDELDSYIGGTLNEQNNQVKNYAVLGTRIDSFFKTHKITKVSLLKSNIEGAERFVVDTMSEENLDIIENIVISCHDFKYLRTGNEFYQTKKYIINFLTSKGFEITTQKTGKDYIDDYIYGVNRRIKQS